MLKGYYIHFEADRWIGVKKKIEVQMKEFQKYFQIEEISIHMNDRSFLRKLYDTVPFVMSNKYNLEDAYEKIENPDFLYIRGTWSDNQYIDFLRRMRIKYPNCKILVEIPTYPYDKSVEKMLVPRERWSRRKYKRYVDCIVTYSEDKEIFGVPTLNIKNGINVDGISPVVDHLNSEKIRLIAVSTMMKTHGYERILNGLGEYYALGGKRDIVINMVGDGPELKKYKKIVNDKKIGKHVIFHGKTMGKKLEEIYNHSDMGLVCFGDFKEGREYSSSLKVREYLSKGLPVISADVEDVFIEHPAPFYLKIPNDKTTVDMGKIIEFYDKLYSCESDKTEICKRIHEFAKKYIDISVTMKPVVQYLLKD